MKVYLSHGLGVNSTALMLFLEDMGVEFESVFVDTGTEWPETYEYLDYLKDLGYKITVLKPNVEGFSSLLEYCQHYKILPFNTQRWCTGKFKVRTLIEYYKKPAIQFVAIAYDEKHRIYRKSRKNVITAYPLVEYKITRRKCIEIIKKHGLKVPKRSGCFICPFMSKQQLKELQIKHPDLYKLRHKLQEEASKRAGRPVYYSNYSIDEKTVSMALWGLEYEI